MEEAKIIFKDGTELDVEVNGSCYICDDEPEFPDDLSKVIIVTDDTETEISNASVQECASVDGRYWFSFVTATEFDKLESQVMFTALMTDTLLEEMEE